MNIRVYKPNHFVNLMEDKKYAVAYLSSQDPHEFTKKRLLELVEENKSFEKKYNKNKIYLSIVRLLQNDKLFHKMLKRNEELTRALQSSNNKIEMFESNLAALILLEIIDIEKAKGLGHNEEYLKCLLENYKTKTDRQYEGYYYDEKSGRTSKITEGGKHIILSYTPQAVICELNKRQRNNMGDKYTKRAF